MNTRITLCLILIAVLLLVTAAGTPSVTGSRIEPETMMGGAYRLVGSGVTVDRVSAGGDYILLGPSAPIGQGSGCCCTYLPCALRNW